MTKQQLKQTIQNLAKELSITFAEACTQMQAAAAEHCNDDEATLRMITSIKMDYLTEKGLI